MAERDGDPRVVQMYRSARLELERVQREMQSLEDRAWTTVFYSYRGGVGRTTCLLNAAVGASFISSPSRHDRVFVLDFDLEAPGIDEFERFAPKDSNQPGLMEYVRAFLDSKDGAPPDLRDFVYERENIWIMRAGRKDEKYLRDLSVHDWDHFYRFEDGALFFENLRGAVKQQLGCNFMFVDSRTGLSNIGGVCLGHLADAAVLVFQPTPAHTTGMKIAVDALRRRDSEPKRLPRFYIATKLREVHEGACDPTQVDFAKKLVCQVESVEFETATFPVPLWDLADPDMMADRTLPEGTIPVPIHVLHHRVASLDGLELAWFPLRDRIKNQHLPDSFVYDPAQRVFLAGRTPEYLRSDSEYISTVITRMQYKNVIGRLRDVIDSVEQFLRVPELSPVAMARAIDDEGVFLIFRGLVGHSFRSADSPLVMQLSARKREVIKNALVRNRALHELCDDGLRSYFVLLGKTLSISIPPPPD